MDEMARTDSAGGKCDARLDIPCPTELKEAVTAIAYLHGVTASEYVRELLHDHLYGKFSRVQRYARGPIKGMGGSSHE